VNVPNIYYLYLCLLKNFPHEGVVANSKPIRIEESSKIRKARLGFQSLPTLGVPKCLRLVGAIQASSRRGKQRKAASLEEGIVWSAGKLSKGSKSVVEAEGLGDVVTDDISSTLRVGFPSQLIG
jgi:hypothetical protein